MRPLLLLCLTLAIPATALGSVTSKLILGVLEGVGEKEAMVREGVGPKNYKRHIRILFAKPSHHWKAFPQNFKTAKEIYWSFERFPKEVVRWTACKDGKPVGELSSKNPPAIKARALVGSHNVFEAADLPDAGPPTRDFAGWSEESLPPPLVVTTFSRCEDPDLWSWRKDGAVELKPLLAVLRAEIAKPGWRKLPENFFEPASYVFADPDVRLFRVHESARDHSRIVTLLVTDNLRAEHRETFFLPAGGGAPTYLGTALLFAAAGDYDHGGSSLVVFKAEGHNREGYVMFDRSLKRVAQFHWSYR